MWVSCLKKNSILTLIIPHWRIGLGINNIGCSAHIATKVFAVHVRREFQLKIISEMLYNTACMHAWTVGLGNISIYRQYRKTGVCNNQYRRLFHMSIILLMQYIAEYIAV